MCIFFTGRERMHVPKGSSREGVVQGCNFGDRDFGFFAKVIICAQLAYLDGFALRMCGRAQQGAARALVPFFSQYTRVTYHFVSNKVTLPWNVYCEKNGAWAQNHLDKLVEQKLWPLQKSWKSLSPKLRPWTTPSVDDPFVTCVRARSVKKRACQQHRLFRN